MTETLLGSRLPRLFTKPLADLSDPANTLGYDFAGFCKHIMNRPLLPWQEELAIRALELIPAKNAFGQVTGKKLRFRTIIVCVARQNGKSFFMIALALYFMIVYQPGELVLSTAQDLDTSGDTWKMGVDSVEENETLVEMLAEDNPVFKQRGAQTLNLANGSAWKVRAASRKGGRGKSARLVLMDELREHLNTEAWSAIANTTLAQESALVCGFSNAGDARSVVLKQQRDRALKSTEDPETSIAIFEWSAPEDAHIDDVKAWLMANPACGWPGTGMTVDTLRAARESSTDNDWKTENLCQWVTVMDRGPWEDGTWERNSAPHSRIKDGTQVTIGIDTSLDRSMSYIAIAGESATEPGKIHVEVIAARAGNAWAAKWLDERFEKIGPSHVVIQGPKGAPAVDIGEELEARGIPVSWAQGADVTGSAVRFYDAVRDGHIVHLSQPVLDMAAMTAQIRYVGDGLFMWDRRNSPIDVSPLVAVSMAWFFLATNPQTKRVSSWESDDDIGLVVV